MASAMGICGGLVGPKSGNVEKALVFVYVFEGSRGHEDAKESFKIFRAEAVGGGRGRVNPPPCGLV